MDREKYEQELQALIKRYKNQIITKEQVRIEYTKRVSSLIEIGYNIIVTDRNMSNGQGEELIITLKRDNAEIDVVLSFDGNDYRVFDTQYDEDDNDFHTVIAQKYRVSKYADVIFDNEDEYDGYDFDQSVKKLQEKYL